MNKNMVKARIMEKFGGQWKFAVAIGEHESNVSRAICGRVPLSAEKEEIWAKALNCKRDELFKNKTDPSRLRSKCRVCYAVWLGDLLNCRDNKCNGLCDVYEAG